MCIRYTWVAESVTLGEAKVGVSVGLAVDGDADGEKVTISEGL